MTLVVISHDLQSAALHGGEILHIRCGAFFCGSTDDYVKTGLYRFMSGGDMPAQNPDFWGFFRMIPRRKEKNSPATISPQSNFFENQHHNSDSPLQRKQSANQNKNIVEGLP
jgi:hypothetical protein